MTQLSLPACKARWASLDPVYLQYLTWRRKADETSTKTPFIPALRKEIQVSQDQLWPWSQTPELWPSLITSTWNNHELSLSAVACWQLSLIHLLMLHIPMKFMSSLENAYILKLNNSASTVHCSSYIIFIHANIFYCFTYLVILFTEMTKTFQGVKDFTFRRDLKTHPSLPQPTLRASSNLSMLQWASLWPSALFLTAGIAASDWSSHVIVCNIKSNTVSRLMQAATQTAWPAGL